MTSVDIIVVPSSSSIGTVTPSDLHIPTAFGRSHPPTPQRMQGHLESDTVLSDTESDDSFEYTPPNLTAKLQAVVQAQRASTQTKTSLPHRLPPRPAASSITMKSEPDCGIPCLRRKQVTGAELPASDDEESDFEMDGESEIESEDEYIDVLPPSKTGKPPKKKAKSAVGRRDPEARNAQNSRAQGKYRRKQNAKRDLVSPCSLGVLSIRSLKP